MKDYEPDYVYMIPVGYKKKEIFYENITHVPVTIRGAFLTDEDKKDKIEFEVNYIVNNRSLTLIIKLYLLMPPMNGFSTSTSLLSGSIK
jgi:hypothetical protein